MKKHILIVDDEPAILFTLAFVLRTHGYKVSQAQNGSEALEMVQKAWDEGLPFDLVMTDIQMPKLNGIGLIDALKAKGMTIPIFVLTGSRDTELMKRLMNKGCCGFLYKPCDFREIARQVKSILEPKASGATRRAATLSMGLGTSL
ncbi:MAG: response regulator [bacterium]|nr:response regulator [bacterium]